MLYEVITDEEPTGPAAPQYFGFTLDQLLLIAGIVFVFIIILIIVFLILTRKSRKKKKALKAMKKKKLAMGAGNMGEMGEGEEHLPIDIKKLSEPPPETKEAAIRREIGEFAESSPEIAAQLLKSWIREDGE